jgi:hypothetical protein
MSEETGIAAQAALALRPGGCLLWSRRTQKEALAMRARILVLGGIAAALSLAVATLVV